MQYKNITNPIWANEEQTQISCTVDILFDTGWETVSFIADPNDIEAHGRAIYAEASQMTIGDYDAPDPIIYVDAYRYKIEVGGINVGGIDIPTDEKTERRIIGGWAKAQSDPTYTINDWTTDGGETKVTLNATQIIAIGNAMDVHFQKCFSAVAQVKANHKVTPYTTKAEVEAAFDTAYASV